MQSKNSRPRAPGWMGIAFLAALACNVAWVKGRAYWQGREAWPGLTPRVSDRGLP